MPGCRHYDEQDHHNDRRWGNLSSVSRPHGLSKHAVLNPKHDYDERQKILWWGSEGVDEGFGIESFWDCRVLRVVVETRAREAVVGGSFRVYSREEREDADPTNSQTAQHPLHHHDQNNNTHRHTSGCCCCCYYYYYYYHHHHHHYYHRSRTTNSKQQKRQQLFANQGLTQIPGSTDTGIGLAQRFHRLLPCAARYLELLKVRAPSWGFCRNISIMGAPYITTSSRPSSTSETSNTPCEACCSSRTLKEALNLHPDCKC